MSEPTKREQIRVWIENVKWGSDFRLNTGTAAIDETFNTHFPRTLAALEATLEELGAYLMDDWPETEHRVEARILAILTDEREEPGDGEG